MSTLKLNAARLALEAKAKHARSLDLSGLELQFLPPPVVETVSLSRLCLANNRISSLPPQLSNLTGLVELDLSKNFFTEIPPLVCRLPALKRLSVKKNRIDSLPSDLPSKLQRLDASYNALSTLPQPISRLTNLSVLSLSHNRFTDFPATLTSMTHLAVLDLSSNSLAHLPAHALSALSGLQKLDVTNNRLEIIPKNSPCLVIDGHAKPDAAHCTYVAPTPSHREFIAGQPAVVHIRLRDAQKQPILGAKEQIHIALMNQVGSKRIIEKNVVVALKEEPKTGRYHLHFTPRKAGVLHVGIDVDGISLRGSPMPCLVRPGQPCPAKCTANGTGLTHCVPGEECKVIVQTRDSDGNACTVGSKRSNVTASLVGDQGETVEPECRDLGDGRHVVVWQVTKAAQWKLTIECDGVAIPDSPFSIRSESNRPHIPSCYLARNGSDEAISVIEPGTSKRGKGYHIVACDKYGNSCNNDGMIMTADVTGDLEVEVKHMSIMVRQGSAATVSIMLDGKHIKGSPFAVGDVSNVCDVDKTIVEYDSQVIAEQECKLTVITRDAASNPVLRVPVTVTVRSSAVTLDCDVYEMTDGKHEVAYTIPIEGVFLIEITVADKPLKQRELTVSAPLIRSLAASAGPGPHVRCKCHADNSPSCKMVSIGIGTKIQDFKARIATAFSAPDVYVQYRDEDNDLVDISTQDDLDQALEWALMSKPARLQLMCSPTDHLVQTSVDQGDDDVFLPVPGTRYAVPGSHGLTRTVYIRQPKSAHSPFIMNRENLPPAPSSAPPAPPRHPHMLRLKCAMDEDVRVIEVPRSMHIQDVLVRVQTEFGRRVSLRYRDSDGDLVTITTQTAYSDAQQLAGHSGALRLFVSMRDEDNVSESPFSPAIMSRVGREYAAGMESVRRVSHGTGRRRQRLLGDRFHVIDGEAMREGMVVLLHARDTLTGNDVVVRIYHDEQVCFVHYMHLQSQRMSAETRIIEKLQGSEYMPQMIQTIRDVVPGRAHALVVDVGGVIGTTLSSHAVTSESEIKLIAKSVANGLAHMHARGVVHCNLTPDCIHKAPNDSHWKIGGLSWARMTGEHLNDTKITKYSSPEESRGVQASPSIDAWHFGAILFEMVTRRPLTVPLNLDAVTDHQTRKLLESLFISNPSSRPSLATCLRHPFFAAHRALDAVRAKASRDQTLDEVEAIRELLSSVAVAVPK